jgi:hypothetical protein
MSDSARMWMEIVFNVFYLIVVWWFVVAMARRRSRVLPEDETVARRFILAFGLLALGDTGHVGFRVVAYLMEDLQATVDFFGRDIGLVGLGALSTAVTVTFFYVVMLMIWHARFNQSYGWFGMALFGAAVLRLVLMAFPQNQWGRTVPPQPWSLYRNAPLTALGLGVAYLMLRDAFREGDRAFRMIGILILVSYAFYVPVILLVQRFPLVGMLMIPKTLAYVGIAMVGYRAIFCGPPESGAERLSQIDRAEAQTG